MIVTGALIFMSAEVHEAGYIGAPNVYGTWPTLKFVGSIHSGEIIRSRKPSKPIKQRGEFSNPAKLRD